MIATMAKPLTLICGIDEAGRGPLAGPVTAACVCLGPDVEIPGIKDSKQLSEKQREELSERIKQEARAFAIVSVGPRRIEQLNILQATKLAMKLAGAKVYRQLKLQDADCEPFFLVDGNGKLESFYPHQTIIKGDQTEVSIGAASILAKVCRDRLMKKIDAKYSSWQFAVHKGYPTPLHKRLIAEQGPSVVHRRTFAGVREYR